VIRLRRTTRSSPSSSITSPTAAQTAAATTATDLAYAVSVDRFTLYELNLSEDADISILDRVKIRPDFEEGIKRGREVDYGDLSDGARSELDYVVEDIVDEDEQRFVDFYNEAQPISLRLHQLNLLPGIGDKLRDNILDERKRSGPSRASRTSRSASTASTAREIIIERILDEMQEDDLKYHNFARS